MKLLWPGLLMMWSVRPVVMMMCEQTFLQLAMLMKNWDDPQGAMSTLMTEQAEMMMIELGTMMMCRPSNMLS